MARVKKEPATYKRVNGSWVQRVKLPTELDGMADKAGAMLIAFWRMYPDRFAALCEAEKPDFRLAPIQIIMLRSQCRYREVFETGGRGITKSYIGLLGRLIMGVLYPGVTLEYFGPSIKQTARIVSSTFKQIEKNYPLLTDMWEVKADSSDRFRVETKLGSTIDVDVMRGTNGNAVFAEEVAQQESGEAFDHEKYRGVVLPAIRLQRMVDSTRDNMFPNFQKCYVTSAGRQQNESFAYRHDTLANAMKGKSAFVLDIPGEVAVLNRIRSVDWYEDMKRKLTPEEWLREMCARWTGTVDNPVIRDSTLSESRTAICMENRHCGDPNVQYIIGYDVAYADHARNAKCATIVLKLERQDISYKRDRFLKTVVYCLDEDPRDSMLQAKRLKERWYRFSIEVGKPTYIAIDARSYGQSVLEDLHKDLGDGLPTLCCYEHERRELELSGALPIIFPINAVGGNAGIGATALSNHDSDSDMLRYAEVEWEQRNVRLLTPNVNEGIQVYKRIHRIKDDISDPTIAIPYLKTRELAGQIANLRKEPSSVGFRERRISRAINRDMWSATKYALRIAQKLEYIELVGSIKRDNPWEMAFNGRVPEKARESQYGNFIPMMGVQRQGIARQRGNGRR